MSSNENLPKKVLIIDADTQVFRSLEDSLFKMKIELFSATNLETALYRFNTQFFDVIIIDQNFPELNGLTIAQKFRQFDSLEKKTVGLLLITGQNFEKQKMDLVSELGYIDIIHKPLKAVSLLSALSKSHLNSTKHKLALKVRQSILDDFAKHKKTDKSINEVKENQKALGKEYFPLILHFYELIDQPQLGLDLLEKMPENVMNPMQKLSMQAKFHLLLGNIEQSRQFFEKADALVPSNMSRIEQMMDMYLKANVPDKCIQKQKELLSMNPENGDLKFDFFNQLELAGFSKESVKFCQESSQPKEVVRYFNNKGVVLAKSKSLEDAIEQYNKALIYFPKSKVNHLIHFNLALAYTKTQNIELFKKATAHLQTCLELNPGYDKAHELMKKLQDKIKSAA